MFRCQPCHRTFNERTGTAFNFLEYPTDIVFEVVFCRLRYKLSYWDVAELFLLRGFLLSHETVRHWEERFAPLFAQQLVLLNKQWISWPGELAQILNSALIVGLSIVTSLEILSNTESLDVI